MTTAVGYGSKAKDKYATAVGYQNTATGNQSSVFGSDSEASGANSLAVGSYARAKATIASAGALRRKQTVRELSPSATRQRVQEKTD